MKTTAILAAVAALLMWSAPLGAEIYHWVDAEGVTHYANTNPPADAARVSKSSEISYDARVDHARKAAEDASLNAYLERESRAEQARIELKAQRLAAETARRDREAAKALARDTAAAQPDYGYTGSYLGHHHFYRPEPCLHGSGVLCQDTHRHFRGGFFRNPRDHFFLSTPAHLQPLFNRHAADHFFLSTPAHLQPLFNRHANVFTHRHVHGNFPHRARHGKHGFRHGTAPLHRNAHGGSRFHR